MARNNADSGETIHWFDTTTAEDLTNKEGLVAFVDNDGVKLHDNNADSTAGNRTARRTRGYIIGRGAYLGMTCSLLFAGITPVVVGAAAIVGQLGVVKGSNARVIPVTASDLRPGDHVLGRFVTAQSTAGARALLDLSEGYIVPATSGVRSGNVITETLAANRTLTVDECLRTTLMIFDPAANRNLDLPTAAAFVAAGLGVGDTFEFIVENAADAAETITPQAGSGGTIDTASPALAQNKNAIIRGTITNATTSSEAYRAYVYIS